jgi:hypothetical protein
VTSFLTLLFLLGSYEVLPLTTMAYLAMAALLLVLIESAPEREGMD